MDSLEYTIFISGVPKNLSFCKLKNLIGKRIDEGQWRVHQIIPLEEWNIIHVACASSDICDMFLELDLGLKENLKTFRSDALNVVPLQIEINNLPTLGNLIPDCLLQIFEKCLLQDQIALAKVCQYFHGLIVKIWSCKYKTLNYNLYDVLENFYLNFCDVGDFYTIVGKFVRTLTFSTTTCLPPVYNLELSRGTRAPRHIRRNSLDNTKLLLNINLCKHLMYFENLEIFELEGNFLADFTVKEVARYCKGLRVLKLFHTNSPLLRGKYVCKLSNLQEFYIKNCENFQRRYLNRICHVLNLKILSILECKGLQSPNYIEKLCVKLNDIQVLQLTTIAAYVGMFRAILKLQSLQTLKFYWLNESNEFENMLFAQILEQHKAEALISLEFINDLIIINNEYRDELTEYSYAALRESVAINGAEWQWNEEKFSGIIKILEKCVNLREISCEYCRLFSHDNVLELPYACSSLKNVNFLGCRSENDARLLETWQRQIYANQCQLNIEGILSAEDVTKLRQESRIGYRLDYNRLPNLRSIKCCFK